MEISVHQASIPTLLRMLRNLEHILQKAAAFAEKERMNPELLLERRLHPDMFPLSRQVEIVVSGAKGCAARLAGRIALDDESPELAVFNRGSEQEFGERLTSFTALRTLIQEALGYLETISREEVDAGPERPISVAKPGEVRVFENPRSFVLLSVLPNLYFHITVVYALLRSAGVPLGKQDFEGAPAYRIRRPAEDAG
ncbi:DUF1993 domain-containing protein [Archangium lipolyticum]|uniref:DUF1993 domain-containing protein n=1 Tax=Archangium lipolyticum TaxID=2970465 RepID=UPI002149A95E|nr:DUF1993 domain-containing protein [Archangium lipolyticum]